MLFVSISRDLRFQVAGDPAATHCGKNTGAECLSLTFTNTLLTFTLLTVTFLLQKILAQIVHCELKEEEAYKDMDFTLNNGNDKIARRIKDLEFRYWLGC